MNTINTNSWKSVGVAESVSGNQALMDQIMKKAKKEDEGGKSGDSEVIIEKSITVSPDGSRIMTMTKITVGADGSKSSPTIIGTYNLGKESQEQSSQMIDQKALEEKSSGGADAASGQYERNSAAYLYGAGMLLNQRG